MRAKDCEQLCQENDKCTAFELSNQGQCIHWYQEVEALEEKDLTVENRKSR